MILSWISARGFLSCAGFPRSFSVRRGKYCKAAWRRQSSVVTNLNAAEKELQGAEKIKLSWGIYPSTVKHKSSSYFVFSSPLSSLLLNCRRNGVSVPFAGSQKHLGISPTRKSCVMWSLPPPERVSAQLTCIPWNHWLPVLLFHSLT